MKLSVILIAIILVVMFHCENIFSQSVKYFGDVKIKANLVYDPEIQSSNLTIIPSKKPVKWIEFDIAYKSAAKSNKKTKSIAWVDDVIMKYDILLPKVSGKPRVVLSGKIEYWALPLDGEVHHAQAFIHPKILLRYVPDLKLSKSKLKDLKVKLTFIVNESIVGLGVLKKKTSTRPKEVVSAIKNALASPNTLKVKNAVYGRNETPWGVLNLSYYQIIKRKNN